MATSTYQLRANSQQFKKFAQGEDCTLAAIDIGTNSIHMVIVKIQPSLPAFEIIAREKDIVRLGHRDRHTGRLTDEAMERSLKALRRCQALANSFQVDSLVAVATSAMREAPNGRDFLQRIKTELNLDVDLISGQEEARRIYLGVLSAVDFNQQPHLLIDIGGGSTEISLVETHEARFLSSTKVGAVRLTQDFVSSDPITDREFITLQAYIRGRLERPIEELREYIKPGEAVKMIGTSGTIETLAEMLAMAELGSTPNPLHGYSFTLKNLDRLIKQMRKLDYEERSDLPGMSEKRAEIILAGAIILREAMDLLGVSEIMLCERALREGVIVDWMLSHGFIESRLSYQSSIRERSIMAIAKKYRVNMDCCQRTAKFSLQIFDQLQGVLHNWDTEAREMLWAAAILHNCGLYISHSAHHKHSYYLIRHAELLGFNETQVEIVANLARYHRKSKPKKKHTNYQNLIHKRQRQMVSELSAIMRLAVALDRRQIGAIAHVDSVYEPDQKHVTLKLIPTHSDDSCELELWSLQYKKAIFEEEFDVTVSATLLI
ncbi:Ppx/GppA phosphatase family protein [[Limnothrix rosea] IAM M-220]|uniref:Ppx/GppA phosphatase family protein n=1 Tax=[Limnothrix rosea] IAM M-220 TaxID=454133 RepID=UPI0009592FC2|nr:Ppx/GppA phosphatase family protein [[Limnothrix rosea] IAM M-220]OKH18281.1 exopolyphosphatase [[Limnothrix rosea] IAM M-220]